MLRKTTSRFFYRTLFAAQLETIQLLKRNDDQQEGTVTAYQVFDCRREATAKSGQPIQGDMSVESSTTWWIPSAELARVGVSYINVLDRIVDRYLRFWQPESGQSIQYRLFENMVRIDCLRVDPPDNLSETGINPLTPLQWQW